LTKSLLAPDITKYITLELGCNGRYDDSKGRSSIGSRQTTAKLQDIVWSFNERYLKCNKCNDPELMIDVVNGTLTRTCNACSHIGGSVSHRCSSYIISHPPLQAANALRIRSNGTSTNDDGISIPFDAISTYTSSLVASLPDLAVSSSSLAPSPTSSSSSSSSTSKIAKVAATVSNHKCSDDDEWSSDDSEKKTATTVKQSDPSSRAILMEETTKPAIVGNKNVDVDIPLTPEQMVRQSWSKALSSPTTASISDIESSVSSSIKNELKRIQMARSLHDIQRYLILLNVISLSAPLSWPAKDMIVDGKSSAVGILKSIRSNIAIIRAVLANRVSLVYPYPYPSGLPFILPLLIAMDR
jgi:hypothetical protein